MVVREASRFVAIRVDLSPGRDTPDRKAFLASYQQHGLPFVALHASDGQIAARITNFTDAASLLTLMHGIK